MIRSGFDCKIRIYVWRTSPNDAFWHYCDMQSCVRKDRKELASEHRRTVEIRPLTFRALHVYTESFDRVFASAG